MPYKSYASQVLSEVETAELMAQYGKATGKIVGGGALTVTTNEPSIDVPISTAYKFISRRWIQGSYWSPKKQAYVRFHP